jgi:hypothetical protein
MRILEALRLWRTYKPLVEGLRALRDLLRARFPKFMGIFDKMLLDLKKAGAKYKTRQVGKRETGQYAPDKKRVHGEWEGGG